MGGRNARMAIGGALRPRAGSGVPLNKNRPIGVHLVAIGSLTASLVHLRELFKAVILANAASFICMHNHSSGDPTPSKEDIEITSRD